MNTKTQTVSVRRFVCHRVRDSFFRKVRVDACVRKMPLGPDVQKILLFHHFKLFFGKSVRVRVRAQKLFYCYVRCTFPKCAGADENSRTLTVC